MLFYQMKVERTARLTGGIAFMRRKAGAGPGAVISVAEIRLTTEGVPAVTVNVLVT